MTYCRNQWDLNQLSYGVIFCCSREKTYCKTKKSSSLLISSLLLFSPKRLIIVFLVVLCLFFVDIIDLVVIIAVFIVVQIVIVVVFLTLSVLILLSSSSLTSLLLLWSSSSPTMFARDAPVDLIVSQVEQKNKAEGKMQGKEDISFWNWKKKIIMRWSMRRWRMTMTWTIWTRPLWQRCSSRSRAIEMTHFTIRDRKKLRQRATR